MARQCVTYFRVSTDRQGQSGLGLEAQREAVRKFMAHNGWDLLAEFEEIETGKGREALVIRPQLQKALKLSRQKRALLVIAKLDRLARNVAFISNLMESGVDFVACDMPDANRLTVHILAAVAEDEARRISERTKAALAAKKARGERMGNPQRPEVLNPPRIEKANQFAESMRAHMEDFKRRSLSHKKMMDELNSREIKSARNSVWSVSGVQNCLKRLGL